MAKRRPDHLLPQEPNPMKGKKGRAVPQEPRRPAPFVPPSKKHSAPEKTLGNSAFDKALLADAKKLKLYNEEITDLEAEVKGIKAEREKLSTDLHYRMLKAGIENIRLEGVGTLSRQIQPFPHIIPGLQKQAMAAIRKLGYGALIQETIHHKSLQSLIKETRAKNIKSIDGVEVFDKPVARIYSNSGKKKEV